MRTFLPLLFGVFVILLFGLIEVLLLRHFNPGWWRSPWIRRSAWGLPLVGVVGVLLWGVGEYYTQNWLALPAAILTALTFICEVSLMFSLPLSGVIHFVQTLLDRAARSRRQAHAAVPDKQRRVVLKGVAAGLPLITLATGLSGFSRAFAGVRVYLREIRFSNLPPDLDGFRILHVSDIHLRHYVTLDDLSEMLQDAAHFSPRLILVTGDIADDLGLLPEALRLLNALNPPYGVYVSLGNHEYFRGISAVRRIFDRSLVPLFVNTGVHLAVGSTAVFVGGIDDPRRMGFVDEHFYRRALDATLTAARQDEFIVLMSHRPDAFPDAAHRGVHLTLAGHTHGAQVGLAGRSLFESVLPERYLWGHYRRRESHLYTSSGVGHWFPFRLGCPPEAPVITLRRT
ncbi:MAG: metallophosphoesterase [Candidatus Zixiibacteriota bacterium]